MKGGVPGKYPSFAETGFDAVMPCVEINQCVGRINNHEVISRR